MDPYRAPNPRTMNSAWGKNSDRSLKLPLKTGVLGVCAPNGGCQWRNPLRCDYLVLVRSPEPKMVGFRDLVGSAYVPVSKNVAVKELIDLLSYSMPPALKVAFMIIKS